MPVSQRQQKFLFDRLQEIRNNKPRNYPGVKLPETPKVKIARREILRFTKIVNQFQKRETRATKKRSEAITSHYDECRGLILFGDAKEALKALDRFEKKSF